MNFDHPSDIPPSSTSPTLADTLWSLVASHGRRPRTSNGPPLLRPVIPRVLERGAGYVVTTSMDRWGRFADRSALQLLGWQRGTAVSMSVLDQAIVVARPDGPHHVGAHGHLSLTASIRRSIGVGSGDRFLLIACADRQILAAYTTPVVERAILALHDASPPGHRT